MKRLSFRMGALVLLSLLAANFAFGSTGFGQTVSSATKVISCSGCVSNDIVYAKMDFESQLSSEVQTQGAFTYFNGTWDYEPNPLYTAIEQDITREGQQACKFMIPDPSTNQRSKICVSFFCSLNLKEAYFGFSIFIPKDFTLNASDWFNFIESDVSPSHRSSWAIIQSDQSWFLWTMIGNPRDVWRADQLLPTGRWTDFVVYCLYDTNGNVKVWLDGNLVCNVFYDTTGGETNPYVEFGAYENNFAPPNWVIFDNVVIANTYLACQMPHKTAGT